MSVSMKSLGLDRLSPAERMLLAEELWESVAANPDDLPLTEAQRTDLEDRLEAYRDDPKAGSDWETVEARLRSGS